MLTRVGACRCGNAGAWRVACGRLNNHNPANHCNSSLCSVCVTGQRESPQSPGHETHADDNRREGCGGGGEVVRIVLPFNDQKDDSGTVGFVGFDTGIPVVFVVEGEEGNACVHPC